MSTFKKTIIYGITLLFGLSAYFALMISLGFTDVIHHILFLFIFIIFPAGIAWLLITKGRKAFWVSLLFFVVGLLFLYRGFYLSGQFSLLDYFFVDKPVIQWSDGIQLYDGIPLSWINLESLLIYMLLSTLGIFIGFISSKKRA